MKKFTRSFLFCSIFIITVFNFPNVQAGEVPIGDPVEIHGMEVTAVYLQAVLMEPQQPTQEVFDVHIEADVRAIENNNNGFGIGEWVPYITVTYFIEKAGTDWKTQGTLEAMVASDGPHYGKNINLNGPGKYKLHYHLEPPNKAGFLRHTDKETGVGRWWEPIDLEWEFVYVGTGKKGGY